METTNKMNSYKSREQPNFDAIVTLEEEVISHNEASENMSDSETSFDFSSEAIEGVRIKPEIFRRLMENQPNTTIDMSEDEKFQSVLEDTKFYEVNETLTLEKKEDASTGAEAKHDDFKIVHKSQL